MLPALVPSAFATAAETSSDAAAASAHPEGRRASFGFENEAVALVKSDALTEDRALLAGFAHDPFEDVAVAFGGRGGGIALRQAQAAKIRQEERSLLAAFLALPALGERFDRFSHTILPLLQRRYRAKLGA